MVPIVAVEIEAPAPSPALQTVLLQACSASLTHLECAPAVEVKGHDPAAIAMITRPQRDVVVVELADSARGAWLTRKLEFEPTDSEVERWKSVGYSIGSLVGSTDVAPEAPRVGDSGISETSDGSPPDAPLRFGAMLGSVTGLGVDGAAWRTGAGLELWGSLWEVPALHLGVTYSVDPDPPEELQLRFLDFSGGFGWHWPVTAHLGTRLRVFANLQNIRASGAAPESSSSSGSQERTAWVPGARLGMDGLWSFSESWAAALRLDVLVQDGATTVNYADQRVATVPAGGFLLGFAVEYAP